MERNGIGWKELKTFNGVHAVKIERSIHEASQPLAETLIDFALGEIYSRTELGRYERKLMILGILPIFGGADPQLPVHLNAALNVSLFADGFITSLNSFYLNKVHFVNLHFSNSIGQLVALQYPEQLNSLTIIASMAWKIKLLRT